MSTMRKILTLVLGMAMFIGAASATTTINMTVVFQPVLDLIALVVNNTDSWIGLVIIGVMIMVAKGIGAFITNTLNDATR